MPKKAVKKKLTPTQKKKRAKLIKSSTSGLIDMDRSNTGEIWKNVNVGRPMIFETPLDLWEAAKSYFEWVEANPLRAEKSFHYEGMVTTHDEPRLRAMTIHGLNVFLGLSSTTFHDYCKRKEFSSICNMIKDIIYEQKFTGAAAGVLTASIIALDLGLKETKPVENDESISISVTRVSKRPKTDG